MVKKSMSANSLSGITIAVMPVRALMYIHTYKKPTYRDHYESSEPQNPSLDGVCVVQKCRSTDYESPNLWNAQSGPSATRRIDQAVTQLKELGELGLFLFQYRYHSWLFSHEFSCSFHIPNLVYQFQGENKERSCGLYPCLIVSKLNKPVYCKQITWLKDGGWIEQTKHGFFST